MRLFLLPISTRRTLIYCERVQETIAAGASPPITDRILTRASTTWAQWEKAEKGWQKQLTSYGNQLFKRIPFEEWGLKSIPPATKKRLEDADAGRIKFECLYPGRFLDGQRVKSVLQTLATERQSLHNKRLWTCIAWMPITIPFTVVPIIPNIPFFYLCFRAYSHYRALYGGRLLEHLIKNNLVQATPSKKMDEMYVAGLLHPSIEKTRDAQTVPSEPQVEEVVADVAARRAAHPDDEAMLLRKWNGKLLAEGFDLPEMEIEIERAVEQVEKKLEDQKAATKPNIEATPQRASDAGTNDEKQSR